MIKRLLLFLPMFVLFSTSLTAQVDFKAGIGLGFASEDFADLGIRFNGVADINEDWSGAANVTFWFTDVDNTGFTTINLDGHYNFYPSDKVKVYPLAGLNFSIFSFDSDLIDNQTEVGLNIGGGTEIMFSDQISGFGELKYIVGDADQLIIAAGGMYNF